ncbi:MAG: S1 RNA-binding domain-containing protein, partial [Kofleriaceae bacterium]|nr:S1 RNA-binding domain-containing protein [Kofleriaceae bacterium]
AAPPDHGSWAFVWTALWKTSAADPELASLARAWLAAAPPDHGSWKYVWEALWKTSAADPELASLARAWLAAAPPDHGSWAFVWTALWKMSTGDARLIELGLAWLRRAPLHRSWAFVWLALHEFEPGSEHLTPLAEQFLDSAQPAHPRYRDVAAKARRAMRDEPMSPSVELQVGQTFAGVVHSCADFGVFVSFHGSRGLLHVTALPLPYAVDCRSHFSPHQPLLVKIKSLDLPAGRVQLELAELLPALREPTTLARIKVGETYDALVVKRFGPGYHVRLGEFDACLRLPTPGPLRHLNRRASIRVVVVEVDPARQWIDVEET